MVIPLLVALLAGPQQRDPLDFTSRTFGDVRPAWITTNWSDPDPFANAWRPYAAILKRYPKYASGTGLPAKAKQLIEKLQTGPINEQTLYHAAASYIVARAVEWDFELDSLNRPCYRTLSNAWMDYNKRTASAEFCRIGFAICSTSIRLDAGEMPVALQKRFRDDRIVIRGLVSYEKSRVVRTAGETWVANASRALSAAKRLPSLPDFRPQDYVTIYNAYTVLFERTKDLGNAKGARDALKKAIPLVPAGLAALLKKDLEAVEKYIAKHGG